MRIFSTGSPAARRPDSTRLSVKIYTHPERITELIAEHLPTVPAALDPAPSLLVGAKRKLVL
ncbi:hypothetical protein ACQPYK_23860 [Streptosporangium sp. CA-135522]|uniref:hypothetical protein n=1 Tax=Streptosporangium sp. CA-135522 TaxID=3240072 RepID=UPI003D8A7DF5